MILANAIRPQTALQILVACVVVLAASVPALGASRDPVRARHGMVASTSTLASSAGVEIMRRGGNAVDAAVAVAFALAVTYPAAGNLGGGGFMMVRTSDGKATAIDYREIAPRAATERMYLDSNGELKQGEGSSLIGYRASGTPGTVAGMEYAWKRYGSGKISWAQLIEPARRLAADGFPVSRRMAQSLLENQQLLNRYTDSRRVFLNNGKLWHEGEILQQKQLAATLARLQRNGAQEFYRGQTARLIAEDMQHNGGLITLNDLRDYAVKERTPVRGTYRGHPVLAMPPPSSGGAVLIQMLNILEGYDFSKMGWSSSAKYHVHIEAMRRAFADRAEWMADPDFAPVPLNGLVDKSYAEVRRGSINLSQASTSKEISAGKPAGWESPQTTHFSIIDRDGNAVSNTYTLNAAYGSGVTVRGTGILLNNEMDDFTSKPGAPNLFGLIQNERNAIEPGKRPLSSMTPAFVLRPDNTFWFAIGSPGGPTIINTVLQVVTNIIDHEMNLQQAIDAPRIHHQWLPDQVMMEPYGMSDDTRRVLAAMGHQFAEKPRYLGDAQGVMIENETGMRLGASDLRGDGVPVGF